jgi:hypothetical protein
MKFSPLAIGAPSLTAMAPTYRSQFTFAIPSTLSRRTPHQSGVLPGCRGKITKPEAEPKRLRFGKTSGLVSFSDRLCIRIILSRVDLAITNA